MAKSRTVTISVRGPRRLRDDLFRLARKAQRTPSDYLRLKLAEIVRLARAEEQKDVA